MGGQQSRLVGKGEDNSLVRSIDNIYAMFKQSNEVILMDLKIKNPYLAIARIKNIESVVQQLLEPFRENSKYNWSEHISCRFKKHFTVNFEPLWTASRQQFYQLLLTNCKIKTKEVIDKSVEGWSYQKAFYQIAAEHIQQRMADTFVGDINEEQLKRGLRNLSVLGEENGMKMHQKDPSDVLPSSIDEIISKKTSQHTGLNTDQSELALKVKQKLGKIRVHSSSLILPQTLFIHKMSLASQEEIYDLLKFYRQFSETLQQIICSNNLISCPIKSFIVCLEEKIGLKKIRTEQVSKSELLGSSQESRKVRKTRQTNNNIILYEIRAFLTAYTEFVWMFLQLHLMEDCNLGKIVQSDVLFGIIFKHLWTYVDWISDRGYEFQEEQLEQYFQKKSINRASKVPEEQLKQYVQLLEQLRGEKHPQQYLKKLIVFYRQVSKQCQNADSLLSLYEQTVRHCAYEKGIRDLRLFRMRNIIQKLLKVEESSLSGGEITYSWTTWCIMIELLKEKVNYKYGKLIISKKASGQVLMFRQSELSQQEQRGSGKKRSVQSDKKKEQESSFGCFRKDSQEQE